MEAVRLAKKLRENMPIVFDVMGRSLGAQLKAAGGSGAKHVIIVGENELKSGKLTLRNMETGIQVSLSLEEIVERLAAEYPCA